MASRDRRRASRVERRGPFRQHVLVLAIAALLAGGPTGGSAAPAGASSLQAGSSGLPTCGPATAHTLAEDNQVRVYVIDGSTRGTYACGSGRTSRVRLDTALRPHVHLYDLVDHVELAGTVVAYAGSTVSVDSGSTDIDVVDVAKGRRLLTVRDAGGFVDAGILSLRKIVDLVVTPRGSVAWTEHETGHVFKRTTFTVSRAEASRPTKVLDTSPTIDPESLRLSGHTVRWQDAGQSRSAALA